MPKRAGYVMVAEDDPGWQRFWGAYPKRFGKKDARKAFAELNPSPELVDRIVGALAWQFRQADWLKSSCQYAPYPASYLRAGRGEEEPVATPMVSEKTARTLTSGAAFVRGGQ